MDEIDKKEIFMTAVKNIKTEVFYKAGFYFLIVFALGFIGGVFFAQNVIIEKKLSDSVKLKGIVINSIPYDLKERL